MNEYDICFVVLHYKTATETEKCMDSLMGLQGFERMGVIMVDNSYVLKDSSGAELFRCYERIGNIYYIPNTENTFFSFGNNLGYRFAKSFHPEFIVTTNSDTVFKQRDFARRLISLKSHVDFDLLGPDIIRCADWKHQNPYALSGMTYEDAKRDIEFYEKEIEEISAGNRMAEPAKVRNVPLFLRKIKRYLDAIRGGGTTSGNRVRIVSCLGHVL